MLLEQRILDLQKDKGALIDKVRELEKESADVQKQKLLQSTILMEQKQEKQLVILIMTKTSFMKLVKQQK